jgi:hypothetical protein
MADGPEIVDTPVAKATQKTADRPHSITIGLGLLTAVIAVGGLVLTWRGQGLTETSQVPFLEVTRTPMEVTPLFDHGPTGDGRNDSLRYTRQVRVGFSVENRGNTPATIIDVGLTLSQFPRPWKLLPIPPYTGTHGKEHYLLDESTSRVIPKATQATTREYPFTFAVPADDAVAQRVLTIPVDRTHKVPIQTFDEWVKVDIEMSYSDEFDNTRTLNWCWGIRTRTNGMVPCSSPVFPASAQ